jgi:hypothetical protein
MREKPSSGARIVGAIGLLAHLAMLVWYAASGLVAPGWAVALLLLVWAALLGFGIWLWIRRPAFVPLVPVAAAAIWFGAISAGEAFLNWTA